MRNVTTALLLLTMTIPAMASETITRQLSLNEHGFEPARLELPANVRIRLVVHNDSSQPAEFESYDLSQEVEIASHEQTAIFIGPLKPGSYAYFNDFDDSMRGTVLVQPVARKEP